MNQFIVIEGDNGSGKTTLAQSLKSFGFAFVSEDAELLEMKFAAKKLHGRDKTEEFYRYNLVAAEKARQIKNATPLIVRYWVSTLAAAYADEVIDFNELERQCRDNVEKFPLPAYFFYLKCNYAERMKRIEERRKVSGIDDDNRDKNRSERYELAVKEISFAVPTPWIFIPADVFDAAQVKKSFLALVAND